MAHRWVLIRLEPINRSSRSSRTAIGTLWSLYPVFSEMFMQMISTDSSAPTMTPSMSIVRPVRATGVVFSISSRSCRPIAQDVDPESTKASLSMPSGKTTATWGLSSMSWTSASVMIARSSLNFLDLTCLDTVPGGVMFLTFLAGVCFFSPFVDKSSSCSFVRGGSDGGWNQSPKLLFLLSFFFLNFHQDPKREWLTTEV